MNKPTVMLIEGDRQFGASLREMIEYFDLDVELIQNGVMALQRLSKVIPRLVVLDLHLPGRHGLEILSSIRADERLNATKVILITADTRVSFFDVTLADDLLFKPFAIEAFNAAIEAAGIRTCGARL